MAWSREKRWKTTHTYINNLSLQGYTVQTGREVKVVLDR